MWRRSWPCGTGWGRRSTTSSGLATTRPLGSRWRTKSWLGQRRRSASLRMRKRKRATSKRGSSCNSANKGEWPPSLRESDRLYICCVLACGGDPRNPNPNEGGTKHNSASRTRMRSTLLLLLPLPWPQCNRTVVETRRLNVVRRRRTVRSIVTDINEASCGRPSILVSSNLCARHRLYTIPYYIPSILYYAMLYTIH